MSDPSDDWREVYEKPLPRYALEEPIVGRMWLLETGGIWERQQPKSDIQALMEAGPNEPELLQEPQSTDLADRVDRIVASVLTDEERAVIEVTVFAGHSIRKASEILGWPRSTVGRLKKSALQIIERELRDEISWREESSSEKDRTGDS